MSAEAEEVEELELGYVSGAHGLKGELAIRPFDPDSQTLASLERVRVRTPDGTRQELRVLSARPTPKAMLVMLAGVSTREQAEALKGATILARREDLDAPEEGEFFQGDLVGLAAEDEAGKPLGRVAEIWATGPVPNLVIRADGGEELVVPFADDFVVSVDLAGKRLVIRPPEFLE